MISLPKNLPIKPSFLSLPGFGFAGIVFGHKVFGWRGKLIALSTQIAFSVLVLSYFGTKFF